MINYCDILVYKPNNFHVMNTVFKIWNDPNTQVWPRLDMNCLCMYSCVNIIYCVVDKFEWWGAEYLLKYEILWEYCIPSQFSFKHQMMSPYLYNKTTHHSWILRIQPSNNTASDIVYYRSDECITINMYMYIFGS